MVAANRSGEELAMRTIAAAALRRAYPDARIVHELPVRYSTNRIDIAAIRPAAIICLEIKSSRDVIDRLEAQLRAFQPVSHRLIVALAPKHNEKLPSVEEPVIRKGNTIGITFRRPRTDAQDVIQRVGGCTTWTIDAETGALEGDVVEQPYHRPGPCWATKMLDMLWRDELAEIARRFSISGGRRNPTHLDYRNACAEALTGRQATEAVCQALRARDAFDAASDPPIGEPLCPTKPDARLERLL